MIEPRYEWISYPDADPGDNLFEWDGNYVGFRMKVLVNPTMMQVRNETEHFTASLGTDVDAQDAYWQYIAPRIPEWKGDWTLNGQPSDPPPPPAERWESLLELPFNLAMWLRMTVHLAHRSKVLARLQNRRADTDSTPSTSPVPQPSPASST